MKLITKKILAALPPLYATELIPLEEQMVICKFFTPDANWTWYVFEGKPVETEEGDDILFFGLVEDFKKECGYFCLSQINKICGSLGLKPERDLSVFKQPLKVIAPHVL